MLNADARVVSDTRKFDRGLTSLLHDELQCFIGWMCQAGSLTRWVSWCTAVFTVRHLGTSPTISSHPPTSLLGFVCVPQTETNSSYLAVVSKHGRRAFSIAGPSVWNSLPDDLRDPACGSDSFKQFLKTILFSLY